MPPFGLVLCAAAAAFGTLAVTAERFGFDQRLLVAGGLAAVAVYALAAVRQPAHFRTLLLVVLGAAALNARLRLTDGPLVAEQRTARYAGVVLDRQRSTDPSDRAAVLTVALDDGLRVTARVRGEPPPIGARVVLRGRLAPFDDARNPGEPSERVLQRERGIDGQVESAAVLRTGRTDLRDWRTWLPRAHEWAHEQLRARLGEPAASIVAGELWGERAALPPDLRAEFQQTGTVHVLVTAGLHLGAIALLCLFVATRLGLTRWLACLLAAAGVWAFVFWSGAQLPAMRAASMATAALAARACGRASFSWNALALAALALIFGEPQSLDTASFALSFSCVGAIFTIAPLLQTRMEAVAALPDRVREGLVLSLSTQLGTWPVTAAVFLQFAPYAVLANLAVVPCVALTMALGAAQLALAWSAPLAQACANLNSWLLLWMLGAVRTFASLPNAAIAMTPAPPWCIAAYDAALLAAPLLWRRGARELALASVVLAAGLVLWPPLWPDGRLRITVLDVGQADAIVVQTPRGHTLLVDAGGRLERGPQSSDSVAERIGERIVVPFLLRHGIHALDAIVLSHPHGDHAGGCAPVLRKLRVAELADGGQTYSGHAYRDCIGSAREDGVPIVYPRAGNEWRTDDGVTLRFIGPSLPFIGGRNAINENSVVFVLRYRRFRMLFTGDAGSAAEQRFLHEGVDLGADVLKVGHHGSAYGSTPEFIAAVHPRYAIISVGRHNLFGHPAPSTIATLERFGARVYRTDENGSVRIQTDGATAIAPPQITSIK